MFISYFVIYQCSKDPFYLIVSLIYCSLNGYGTIVDMVIHIQLALKCRNQENSFSIVRTHSPLIFTKALMFRQHFELSRSLEAKVKIPT